VSQQAGTSELTADPAAEAAAADATARPGRANFRAVFPALLDAFAEPRGEISDPGR